MAYLWQRLVEPVGALGAGLRWLKLWETPNNVFELGLPLDSFAGFTGFTGVAGSGSAGRQAAQGGAV